MTITVSQKSLLRMNIKIISSKVMEKAGFKKDGTIPNRRLNKDGTYSGVEYYSKMK